MLLRNKNLIWLLILFMLSACGFHLRGALQLPDEFSSVYLSGKNSGSELLRDLKRILQTNGSQLQDNALDARAIIKIEDEITTQRVVSVDSQGRASEYELKLGIIFSVGLVEDKEHTGFRIKSKKLELVRDYIYDNEAVLGKSREKEILIRDMQRDASRLIMLQIQAAYRAEKVTDSNTAPVTNLKL